MWTVILGLASNIFKAFGSLPALIDKISGLFKRYKAEKETKRKYDKIKEALNKQYSLPIETIDRLEKVIERHRRLKAEAEAKEKKNNATK